MSRSFLRLDNAALIFPAIRRRDWINVFRQSVTLQEPVDPEILQQAVDDLAPRFRSMYVRLCAGVFWYYLEQAKQPPRVQPDYAYPLTHMPGQRPAPLLLPGAVPSQPHRRGIFPRPNRRHRRDGLSQDADRPLYHAKIPRRHPPEDGVLDWRQPAPPEELEDSFQRHTGAKPLSRTEPNAYRLRAPRSPTASCT